VGNRLRKSVVGSETLLLHLHLRQVGYIGRVKKYTPSKVQENQHFSSQTKIQRSSKLFFGAEAHSEYVAFKENLQRDISISRAKIIITF
jgi:hypothetical protein